MFGFDPRLTSRRSVVHGTLSDARRHRTYIDQSSRATHYILKPSSKPAKPENLARLTYMSRPGVSRHRTGCVRAVGSPRRFRRQPPARARRPAYRCPADDRDIAATSWPPSGVSASCGLLLASPLPGPACKSRCRRYRSRGAVEGILSGLVVEVLGQSLTFTERSRNSRRIDLALLAVSTIAPAPGTAGPTEDRCPL